MGEADVSYSPGKMEEEEEAAEMDETSRFCRYSPEVGTGRFKHVYKGFDEKQGIDIAWSRILQDVNGLVDEQMESIVSELAKGLQLDHPNIIRCYKAWHDREQRCINFITEFFTSGNLRDFRQQHQHLELKAVKKWGKQILMGLDYLHGLNIVHGDLRCDKIYINGHSGEIKIGDLGLATLQEKRFAPGVLPNGSGNGNQYTKSVDIFAFGLCVLELSTIRVLDRGNQQNWPEVVDLVNDSDTKAFILRCVAPMEDRPKAKDLLDDPFLAIKKEAPKREMNRPPSQKKMGGEAVAELPGGTSLVLQPADQSSRASLSSDDVPNGATAVKAGIVRGEDYSFHFTGKVIDGKLSFRLKMETVDETNENTPSQLQTIDFVYDPEVDTPDEIAVEIGNEFLLSSTDRDICAAALKEWLAKGLEDDQDDDEENS